MKKQQQHQQPQLSKLNITEIYLTSLWYGTHTYAHYYVGRTMAKLRAQGLLNQ